MAVAVAGISPAASSTGVLPGAAFDINLTDGVDITLSLIEVEIEGVKIDDTSGFLDFYNTVDGTGAADRTDIQCVARQPWFIDLAGTVNIEVWHNSVSIYTATFTAAEAGEIEHYASAADVLSTNAIGADRRGDCDAIWSNWDSFATEYGDAVVDWIPVGDQPSSFDAIWRAALYVLYSLPGSAVFGVFNEGQVPGSAILYGTKVSTTPGSALLQAYAAFAHRSSSILGIEHYSATASGALLGIPHENAFVGSGVLAFINDDAILEVHVMDSTLKSFWEAEGVVFQDPT